MNFKVTLLILIIWSSFDGLNGQFEFIGCNYFLQNTTYACSMDIYNPSGLKIFGNIEGTHLPNKTDEDVTHITCDRVVAMPNYPAIILKKFRNLEKLELHNSIFESCDENSFLYCKNLLYLDFGYNKFKRLEDNVFKNCKSLTHLSFLGNQITYISEFSFSNLTTLSVLILSGNPLESFAKNIFKPLSGLTRLEAFSLKLKVVHANSFGGHRFLKNIILHSNQINAFDETIIDITAVNLLDVRNNVCVNFNLNDPTILRTSIRAHMKTCFQNYKSLQAGT